MFLTSMFMGVKIRTMWMTPFYLFIGVLFVYIFQNKIKLSKLKYFISVFLILFILSPAAYFYVSITETDKRTDYPGREIAKEVKNKFEEDFVGKIMWVVGDEWHGGNLSYHLKSRPKWFYVLRDLDISKKDKFLVGNITTIGATGAETSKKFSTICKDTKGKFHIVKGIGFCMHGTEKK